MIKKDPLQILSLIGQTIFDKKGFNILAIDVREISSMTDYFLIAEGNVDKHVKAIAQTLIQVLEAKGEKPIQVEGIENGDWVVLDFLEIVVHLFIPRMREKYRLEELWQQGKVVNLNIVLPERISST
jgi:ribosome-associated protein